jgi:opacity protein-like surface antigen
MKKRLVIAFVFCFVIIHPLISDGQGALKFRFSGNSTKFMKEPQGKEINLPYIDSLILYKGPFPDFTHRGGLGFEAEIFGALSDKFYVGLEFSNDLLTGQNDDPGMFNFQFTDSLQLHYNIPLNDTTYIVRTMDPIKYRTSLMSFMANFRVYPLTAGRFHPFIKASAGLSLVKTELSLKNPSLWTTDSTINYGPPVLFSTDRSGFVPALTLGGGLGFELQLTKKISFYTDWSYKMVKSDLLDGRPNFDFNKETGKLDRFNTWSTAGKLTFGIVYILKDNFSLFGGGGSSSKKGAIGGRTSPFLPYYELKPR